MGCVGRVVEGAAENNNNDTSDPLLAEIQKSIHEPAFRPSILSATYLLQYYPFLLIVTESLTACLSPIPGLPSDFWIFPFFCVILGLPLYRNSTSWPRSGARILNTPFLARS
jgi:hypothetical protein